MEKGFTLVELLVTIAIVGLLAQISILNFNSYKEQARFAAAQVYARNAFTALEVSTGEISEFENGNITLSCAVNQDLSSSCFGFIPIASFTAAAGEPYDRFLPGYRHKEGYFLRYGFTGSIPDITVVDCKHSNGWRIFGGISGKFDSYNGGC